MKLIKLLYTYIFILLLCQSTYAKGELIDSLKIKLETSEGFDKIDLLNQLSNAYIYQQPAQSIKLAQEALQISDSVDDPLRKASSLYNIADGYRMEGENSKSLNYFLRALEIYRQLDDKDGIAKSYNSIGIIYRFMGDFDTALNYHLDAISIYDEMGNMSGIATSMINTGVIYRNLGKTGIALDYYKKAMDISKRNKDFTNIVNALVSIGNVYWYDGENDKALKFYEDALEIAKQDDFKGDPPTGIINNIGNVYREKGDYEKALDYYFQSLDLGRKLGDKNIIAVTLKNIGISYKESANLSQAIQYFNESKDLADEIHLLKIKRETLDQLSQTYILLADYKKALEYYTEFSELKDSIIDQEASNKISIIQLKSDIKEKEQENTIKEKDTDLVLARERNIRNFIIFITLLAILLLFILWNRYKMKLKVNKELTVLNTELEKRVEERTLRLREENEQRRIAQEQAEIANDTKNRFLATISHEVRTPVNAIIGFCDLTIKSDIDPKHQENLMRVKDSSEHLLGLIKDILDFSQIESGKMELKIASFEIKKLILSVLNAFYLDTKTKGINLTHNIDPQIPDYAIGDADAVRQVLYNLIGNAVKFTDTGDVRVDVNQEMINNEEDDLKLIFSVTDTGIGISKLKQKLIFMDFTQVDSSPNRRFGGAGLGLTISKYFVELMGGKITVESEKGQGSKFVVSVILKSDTKKSDKTNIPIFKESKPLHILIAEDNLLNSQVVMAFLSRLGHTSKVASNGKIALGILAEEDFDVVLMDIEMPEMDGFEATEAIRNGYDGIRNPNIPIIALTAHALKEYELKCYKAGMDNYLTKPIDIDKLSEILQAV